MTSKHTPGPWYVFNETAVRSRNQHPAVAKCDTTHGLGVWADVERANARLIAAAPDLLAALENILSRFDDDNLKLTVDAIQESRAAVKKAKGE